MNHASTKLDSIDLRILQLLTKNGRASNHAIAENAGLSESAVSRRIQDLEKKGIIRGYRAVIDERTFGIAMTVFVRVTLERQSGPALEAFEKTVRAVPNVVDCHLMAGEFDYLLRIGVSDMVDFERIHKQHLSRLPGTARIESTFAVREVVSRGLDVALDWFPDRT